MWLCKSGGDIASQSISPHPSPLGCAFVSQKNIVRFFSSVAKSFGQETVCCMLQSVNKLSERAYSQRSYMFSKQVLIILALYFLKYLLKCSILLGQFLLLPADKVRVQRWNYIQPVKLEKKLGQLANKLFGCLFVILLSVKVLRLISFIYHGTKLACGPK